MTKHQKSIIQYIHGNYEDATEPEIRELLRPYMADWNKIRSQHIMQQIEKARDERKLVCGIQQVWEAASHKNGRLLIVEKDFMFPAQQSSTPDHIYKHDPESHSPFYIKDAVDDVMEKILECGGDVEFVDNGLLENEGHIALIKFF
jgi:peptide subunit release factor 1 (eRF1)